MVFSDLAVPIGYLFIGFINIWKEPGLMDIEGLIRGYKTKILKKLIGNPTCPHVSLKALDMSFKLANDYPSQRNINLNADLVVSSVDLEEYSRK
jgi:hypothetical protein